MKMNEAEIYIKMFCDMRECWRATKLDRGAKYILIEQDLNRLITDASNRSDKFIRTKFPSHIEYQIIFQDGSILNIQAIIESLMPLKYRDIIVSADHSFCADSAESADVRKTRQ